MKSYINSLQIAHRFGLHLYLYPPIIVILGNIQCALMQIVKSLYGRKYDLNNQKIKWNSVPKFLFLEMGAGKNQNQLSQRRVVLRYLSKCTLLSFYSLNCICK